MFGLEGGAVVAGFALTIFSAGLCVVYGLLNWNRGEPAEEEGSRQQLWEREERQLEENL